MNTPPVKIAGMIAAVFPGQGSQKPGMGKDLYDSRPEAKAVFEEASDASRVDIAKLCFDADEGTLRQTQNAQLALFTCGVSAYRCLDAHLKGITLISAFAGHSVGEYAALVAAEVLGLADGARLVKRRGELMAESGKERPGTMSAVLGLERAALEEICRSTAGVVVVANDNCLGQLVISGEVEAVRLAGEAATANGAKRVLPLNVSGAFHSPLMDEPAATLAKDLKMTEFHDGGRMYSNVTAQPVVQQGRWPELLELQLKSPVRWTETIQNMLNEDVTEFIECGGGDVLSGLIKRIDREAKSYRVQDPGSLESTIAAVRA